MPTTPHIIRAFQWDLARQVERLDFLLKWLPHYAEWGYQELHLHLEDAVEYPSLPAVARSDAYSYAQFARLVEAATAAGIRVVPIVNLLGHTQYLIKVPGLRDLNELRDPSDRPLGRGQICPLHPRTLEIAEKLLRDMAPFCTAGKVHVGLDESFHLGKCPRCRAEIARAGLAGHFAAHVNRLHERTASFGLRLGLWADMLALLPAAIPQLPRDVIAYDWYYYPFTRHPRVELHNFAEVDLAPPLRAQGIEYWGCPMNGAFCYEPLPVFGERMENILSWWRRCRRVGAGGFLITSWEANRLAIELTTAIDAAAACLWLDPDVDDPREMLARGFERVFGGKPIRNCRAASSAVAERLWRDRPDAAKTGSVQMLGGVRRPRPTNAAECRRWARAAFACDEYAFAGYHRWQINDRWDVCAGREDIAPYEREEKALTRICRSLLAGDTSYRLQAGSYNALAASAAFRRYLAQRDVFVRRCAQAVFQLRQEIVRNAVPPPALSGGTGLPWAPKAWQRRLTRDPSHMDQEVHATQRGLKHRATLNQLRHEAAVFAAALRAGRRAARTMWNLSRNPATRGPNELMLDQDAKRLREWRRWLGQAARDRDLIWQATPVCGAWQLQFTVHNFAPALQKVVVEQQLPNGSWKTLHALPLMEFRAQAARPRTKIRREFSVPILVSAPEPAIPSSTGWNRPSRQVPARRDGELHLQWPCLRLAVRGVGQVAISGVELTDGVIRHHARGWPPVRKKILGRTAPCRGFPVVDWTKNQDSKRLTFRPSRNSSHGTQRMLSRFRRFLPR